jgi:hypothetical protein
MPFFRQYFTIISSVPRLGARGRVRSRRVGQVRGQAEGDRLLRAALGRNEAEAVQVARGTRILS